MVRREENKRLLGISHGQKSAIRQSLKTATNLVAVTI
jgi:hypothetical protein